MTNITFSNKKILILAPHTDDGELGCGATISKLIENNNEVYYAAFSACKQSLLKDFPEDILVTEVKAATKILGIKPENLILYDFQVRTFNYHRQEILDTLIKLKNEINPHIIFIPSINDLHQDHSTIANEAIRAFKHCTILSYEVPWNNVSFYTGCFVILEKKHVEKKVEAIHEYKSQAHRSYINGEFIRSLATVRGVQVGAKYAETFDVVRLIL
ncbi:MAG: LmbE family protein [Bacteroidetes bacterium]|nr:LmbE family protein [Bacteroidota bacterium]